ncbi:hypothetical protein KC363_g5637 [Hortaea werneckii]|uniref:Uncharacterized protein n=1 Tax=Hortaea werneckii TaxID=91943 RepID=A0A3M7FHS7_HORWE|nr:hypothetical protein KC363_g5637 [Hortaea werneckii]RMY88227.1 hypothetical protein D0861_04957 [Hortaea werneckii]
MSSSLRAMQLVHRDLQASPLFPVARRSETSVRKGRFLPGSRAFARDSKEIELPALVSHWAVRIEESPGEGEEGDIRKWKYFGLDSPNGKDCELTEERWKVLGPPASRVCGSSNEDDETIREMALLAIGEFDTYSLMANNCQDFALYLFLKVANFIEDPQRLLHLASQRRLPFVQQLLNVRTTEWKQESSQCSGMTETIEEIVADDRRGRRIFTWPIAVRRNFEDEGLDERALQLSMANKDLRSEVAKPYRRPNVAYQVD